MFANNLKESHSLSLSDNLSLSPFHSHIISNPLDIINKESRNSAHKPFPPNTKKKLLFSLKQSHNVKHWVCGITTTHMLIYMERTKQAIEWNYSIRKCVNICQKQLPEKRAKPTKVYKAKHSSECYYLGVEACWSHYYWKALLLSYKHFEYTTRNILTLNL